MAAMDAGLDRQIVTKGQRSERERERERERRRERRTRKGNALIRNITGSQSGRQSDRKTGVVQDFPVTRNPRADVAVVGDFIES